MLGELFSGIYFNKFLSHKNLLEIIIKRSKQMTQKELRRLYNERIIREKQSYIAKVVHINPSLLSQFRKGRVDLYPKYFENLKAYLTGENS